MRKVFCGICGTEHNYHLNGQVLLFKGKSIPICDRCSNLVAEGINNLIQKLKEEFENGTETEKCAHCGNPLGDCSTRIGISTDPLGRDMIMYCSKECMDAAKKES